MVDPQYVEAAITDIASLGFHGIELFGNQIEAMEAHGGVGALLDKHKLPLVSAYCSTNLSDAEKRSDAIAKTLGWAKLVKKYNGKIVVVGPNGVKRDGYDFKAHKDAIVTTLNEVGKADALARHVNGLGPRALEGHLRACCAANAWVRAMCRSRPFTNGSQLLEIADATWRALPREAWLEAFAAHPRIGETKASPQRETRWSANEQGTARRSSSQTLSSVAIANAQYEEKFGWVFLINATGKTGADILHVMRARMHNTPQAELSVAAEELRQIMNLRLFKLIGG